jgi:Uma2 family endonuclease
LCVTQGKPAEETLTSPPFLCIEILSPEDSALELRMKIEEYLAMGVDYVWVIDPVSLTGEICTRDRIEKIVNARFSPGEIRIDLAQLD